MSQYTTPSTVWPQETRVGQNEQRYPNASQLLDFGLGIAFSNLPEMSRQSTSSYNLNTARSTEVHNRPPRPKSADCWTDLEIGGKAVVNIRNGARVEGNNVVVGGGLVRSGTIPQYGKTRVNVDLEVNIDESATIKAREAALIGVQYAELVQHKSLLEYIGDEPDALKILSDFLGPERHDFKFNTNDPGKAEKTIRLTPMNIVKVMKSICMITWPVGSNGMGIGTGFLTTLPGFAGVALLSAGHNFPPGREKKFRKHWDNCKFYFNALEGDLTANDVVTFSPSDYNYTLVTTLWDTEDEYGVRVIMGKDRTFKKEETDDFPEMLKYQDYSAILMDEDAKDDLINNKGLRVLQVCTEDLDTHLHEPVCYIGHPYIKDHSSKAMRFSYGTCKIPEQDECKYRIRYDLDTEGGASGSPVMGSHYTVEAIHVTGYDNAINGGQIIRSVLKDLVQADVGVEGLEED